METGSGISCRQFRRMLLIEIGSIGCLFVTLWAGNENGLLVVLMSIIGGLIYGSIIMKIGQIGDGYEAVTERVLNGFWWRFVWILYILRFVIRAAWILSYLEYLIRETLYDGSRLMVLLPLLLLCGYAGMRNPEGRARFVELLFWWIIIPLVGLFLIGLWKADLGSLMPTAEVSLPSLWQGDYRLMVLYLPVELILFRMMSGRENGKELWRAVLSSILAAGLWMLLVYSVTAGILGAAWSGKSLLGVTEAMELIAVHGGGLERLDILLILVWLVGGIVTLSAYLFQAQQLLLRTITVRRHVWLGQLCLLLLVMAVYFCIPDAEQWTQWYLQYACWVDVPLSVGLPLLILLVYRITGGMREDRFQKQWKKPPVKEFCLLFLLGVLAVGMTGCRMQATIEDRTYVEELHIVAEETGYRYTCILSYVDAQAEKLLEKAEAYAETTVDIDTLNQDFGRLTGSRLDYSHLQGIYLEGSIYRSQDARAVLADIREDTQAVLSTPVYEEEREIGDQTGRLLGDWLKEGIE